MAIHELATNASKYGALSLPGGKVELAWATRGFGGSDVTLVWQEHGGPPVEPPQRRGLGSRLITRNANFKQACFEFLPQGVRCTIVLSSAKGDGRGCFEA